MAQMGNFVRRGAGLRHRCLVPPPQTKCLILKMEWLFQVKLKWMLLLPKMSLIFSS